VIKKRALHMAIQNKIRRNNRYLCRGINIKKSKGVRGARGIR
jgi:hypothetical protein